MTPVAPEPAAPVCYVAHCLLNSNAKVDEGARCAGVFEPLLVRLRRRGFVVRQLPCPELAFGGLRRFWAVREQYDTPAFRAHCRRLVGPVVAMIAADLARGAPVLLVGLDGSPSMGVELTAASREWGGRPDKPRDEDYPLVPGAGLFTETLVAALRVSVGAEIACVGIAQDAFDYDEERELRKVDRVLATSAMDTHAG